MHVVPNPVPPSDLRSGRAGLVVVRLRRDVARTDADDLAAHAERAGLAELARLLVAWGDPPSRRMVISVPQGVLLEAEADARRSPWPPLHSLTQYWRVDLTKLNETLDAVLERLNATPGVDLAYPESEVQDAAVVLPGDDPLNVDQGYLDPAPTGIDARFVWSALQVDGGRVGIIDVEERWLLGHRAFATAPQRIAGTNHADVDGDGYHGTAALGVVVARDDTLGIIGIVPGAGPVRWSSHYRPDEPALWRHWLTDAITAAVAATTPRPAPGDILMIEVDRLYEDRVPAEAAPDTLDALRLAAALGHVVVAAAGNGGVNLDTWSYRYLPTVSFNPSSPLFLDSGSILVGASTPDPPGHDKWSDSNYGLRVDCFSWGIHVASAGSMEPQDGVPATEVYSSDFAGTSSATAIIAGAAALVQSAHTAAAGTRIMPLPMRKLLSDHATGTLPVGTYAGTLGVQPDLSAVVARLGLLPDVYLRDAVGDTGAVPSAGPTGQSPDVICRRVPVADPAAAFGELSGTANDPLLSDGPVDGQDATVYVRVRNRGAVAATDVRALVYRTPVATVQHPADWTIIGFSGPFTVPPGDTLTVGPGITWPAAGRPAGPHGLVVVLENPAEPQAPMPATLTWDQFVAVVENTNDITFRNVAVIDVPPGGGPVPLPFVLSGDPARARRFDLRFDVRLPEGSTLRLELPRPAVDVLPAGRWADAERTPSGGVSIALPRTGTTLAGIRVPAGARYRCRLLLDPCAGLAAGLHGVSVHQIADGTQVGGMAWTIRSEPGPCNERRDGPE